MPTLKEIKGRIGSVKSTLKITSAMKLVSSAKLRKAQNAIAAMRPYEETLQGMLSLVGGASVQDSASPAPESKAPGVIVAIASNSSLCGGFNSNVIAKVRSVRRPGDLVYSIGRKMADAMAKDGFPSPADLSHLAEHPDYSSAASLVEKLMEDMAQGRIGSVTLVYTHFVSSAKQIPVTETLISGGDIIPSAKNNADAPGIMPPPETPSDVSDSVILSVSEESPSIDAILEPSAAELRAQLYPKTLKLKLYAAILDSAAAEHAARTIAMQTATDNAENLLAELTLQYNKGRQQKITSEILDLAGGQVAQQ